MFSRPGRWLVLVFLALLALPAIGMAWTGPSAFSRAENRMLAARPSLPASLGDWHAYPAQLDRFLQDNFGFRESLIRAYQQGRRKLGFRLQTRQVVAGQGDWLLLEDSLPSSLGVRIEPKVAAAYAETVCPLNALVERNGGRLLFTIAPNTATIYPEALPDWLPQPPARTQYDLVLEQVAACGVRTLDLRPVLRAAKAGGQVYYRQDSHWTLRGSLAAYNAIVDAFGLADWQKPAQQFQWREMTRRGDLIALSGMVEDPWETIEVPDLQERPRPKDQRVPIAGLRDYREQPSFAADSGRPGLRVLVIGDSYAADYLEQYFLPHISRFAFIHHWICAFDRSVVEREKPDLVIFMPVERTVCVSNGAKP